MIRSVHESGTRLEPIFDVFAGTVGWLEDGTTFSDDGLPAAFISGGSVFAAESGHYIGRLDDGVFRDRLGCIVATLSGAGPTLGQRPLRGARRPPDIRSRVLPGRAHPAAVPLHPTKPLLNRSSLDWGRFVAGCRAQWPWETRL